MSGEEISKGTLVGVCTRTYKDGSRYAGEARNGMRCGVGTLTMPPPSDVVIEANFLDDTTTTGRAVVRYPDGARYEGELRELVPHGCGLHTQQDGTTTNGEFELGLPTRGIIRSPDGSIYTGEIEDWKPAHRCEPAAPKRQKTE